MNASSPRLASAIAAALALGALAPSGARAWSLFSSEESRMWKTAESALEAAGTARREGRVMDEIDSLTESGRTFAELSERFPGYKPEETDSRRREISVRMRALMAAVRNGEIAVPEPDAPWRGEDAASVDVPTARPAPETPDDGPAFRLGIPDLVRVEPAGAAPAPAPEPAAPSAPASREDMDPAARRIDSTIPNPFFDPASAPSAPSISVTVREIAADLPAGPAAVGSVPGASAQGPSPAGPSPAGSVPGASAPGAAPAGSVPGASAPGPASDAVELRAISEMIKTARAPDAVILLEDIVERGGASAPLAARLLLARALLECRNYPRAKEALDAVPAFAASDPSVRTLRAAVCVATGRPQEALLQLDQLVSEHPDWSDAYVDLAYVMFLIDPRENRDDAIAYYRSGLSFGARRDARLESELGIRIGE